MRKRTVVISRETSCPWQPNIKRNIQKKSASFSGFINPVFVVLGCGVFAGLLYLYSVNSTAVKGLEIRSIERQITQMQKEKEALKIREAELKSLHKIEQSSRDMNMLELGDVEYIEEAPKVAVKLP